MQYRAQLFQAIPETNTRWRKVTDVFFNSDAPEEELKKIIESLENPEHSGFPHHEVICSAECLEGEK
jgi:hypothetical protein